MPKRAALVNTAEGACARLVLCHGAGAPADSPFLNSLATQLTRLGVTVIRLELAYMAERRFGGKKRPPPKIETLKEEWIRMLQEDCFDLHPHLPLFLAGKSMGARLAIMASASQGDLLCEVVGSIAFGYPFHPQGKPDKLRLAPLAVVADQQIPTLIIQGTRDAFGSEAEVNHYDIPQEIALRWLPTGDHDFKPLKSTGKTQEDLTAEAANFTAAFIKEQLASRNH